jgi:hypothetical protein
MVSSEGSALSEHEVVSIQIKLVSVVKANCSDAGRLRRVWLGEPNTSNIRGLAYDRPDFLESFWISQATAIEWKLELPVHECAGLDRGWMRLGHERTSPNEFIR